MYGVNFLTEQGSPYIRRENLQSRSNKPCSLPKITLENIYVLSIWKMYEILTTINSWSKMK